MPQGHRAFRPILLVINDIVAQHIVPRRLSGNMRAKASYQILVTRRRIHSRRHWTGVSREPLSLEHGSRGAADIVGAWVGATLFNLELEPHPKYLGECIHLVSGMFS